MMKNRNIASLAAFAVGIVSGALLLRLVYARPVGIPEARRRALQILDRPAALTDTGDSKIVAAVKKIEPAVVNIDTVGQSRGDDMAGSMFASPEVRGKGSGVIFTPDGYVVTNNHVIEGAKRIRVTLPTGAWYYATLVGADADTDLAVVHVDAANLPAAELGDSDRLQVGEWSIAVGNPLGLGSTTTLGVVSALNRRNLQVDEGRDIDGAIQTDAAINRGNSGGALANINGQLIGINTAILSSAPGGGSIGLGFALPVNTVRRVVREIISTGKAAPARHATPWLGIQYAPITQDDAKRLGRPADQGVFIRKVLPNTPASTAGLAPDDVVLSIDGKQVLEGRDVVEAVQQTRIDGVCKVRIYRPSEHKELDFTVTVRDRPGTLPVLR